MSELIEYETKLIVYLQSHNQSSLAIYFYVIRLGKLLEMQILRINRTSTVKLQENDLFTEKLGWHYR
jgi:hypothetical protein